ncbi:neutral/alkaline non-lysosomal ceramidase N-terminal domain-containing protein [Planctomyces sp. SH-PL62]|uniref:neutral/alkaline non-lysosomal ceramidase N-terminal domain-containing protein n=1 Tax=Planctomyces sp. SH-PL62 TaxID=1636152 RepID=UPI00078B6E5E|nr:neutral/alkaline non-lysosomal ceramidase N-terminal domain-containing protein [Planctomyces sp. SH-PL62]AMV36492.1 Neutral ceramidase precursor [Planctomyces sp. SH-PL62]
MTTTMRRLTACWLAIAATAVSARAGDGWSAGAAAADVTPAGPVWLAGYASRKTPSEGVTIPIKVKALALRDGGGATAVLLTADVVGFDRAFADRVFAAIQAAHGLPREAVALFASHTHTAPLVRDARPMLAERGIDLDRAKPNDDFRRDVEAKLVATAGAAIAALRPVSLAFGEGEVSFAINRREKTASGFRIGRNPDGPVDRAVPVLRAVADDGSLVAVLFGYACHNTTLTDKIMTISGDYAGFAQAKLEDDHPGAVALFVMGCGGDANPDPRGTVELGVRHGHALADAVEAVLDDPARLRPVAGRLNAAFDEAPLPLAGPTDRASYEARLQETPENPARRSHAQRLIADIDAGRGVTTTYPAPVQAFALGDSLVLVALAGEVVVDYSLRLKREEVSPGRSLWVAAYANDVLGYVPSARVLAEGGYEGGDALYYAYASLPGPFAPEVEPILVGAVKRLLERVGRKP